MKRQRPKRKDRTKALAIVFSVVGICLAVFFFAAIYAIHDCAGENCAVCGQIRSASEILQQFLKGMAGIFSIASAGVTTTFLHLPPKFRLLEQNTPVSVKIRLND